MMTNFWKWCFKWSALYYIRSYGKKQRGNFYKQKIMLVTFPQWVEMVQALGEAEASLIRQYRESKGINEAEFFAEKFEKINETKKILESAWM